MAYQPKPGFMSGWKDKGGKNPAAKGTFVAHRNIAAGEEIDRALWHNTKKKQQNSPDWTGKVSDRFQPKQSGNMSRDEYNREHGYSGASQPQHVSEAFDDDIPF